MTLVRPLNLGRLHVAVDSKAGSAEIAVANAGLLGALKHNRSAEMIHYGVPEQGCDVFKRSVIVVKETRNKALTDPDTDLEDVHHTNLPWIGYTSFAQAPRVWKSKHVLGCSVSVVREIDGYLYHLAVDIAEYQPRVPTPRIVTVPLLEPGDTHYEFKFNSKLGVEELEEHFGGVPPIPPVLIQELEDLGWKLTPVGFVHDWLKDHNRCIRVDLYGKLVDYNRL